MKKYDNYKDSGIEWLGEIPEHWEVKSFRFCIDILTDYTANGSFASLAENVTYYDRGYSRLVRLTDLRVNLINDGLYVDENAHKFLKKSELFGGELLIANVGAYAGLVMQMPKIDGKFTLGPNMFLLHLNQNTDFFINQLNAQFCSEQLKLMAISSAQPKLNKENIRQLKVVTPSIEEQTSIANYLDYKTNQIDTLISKKQQFISLFQEERIAVINQAVTKGLDPNVLMKDSGIEWLEEIPEHWEIKKLKNIFNTGKGLTITKENLTDEGIPCVNYGEIHSKFGFELDTKIHKLKCVGFDYLDSDERSLIKFGDFVFADTSEDINGAGNFTYLKSNEKTFAGYHTVTLKPFEKIESRFFAYKFDSTIFRTQIRQSVKGIKVFSITQSILKNVNVWIPPVKEQLQIIDFLDIETNRIDTIISKTNQEIELLKEYKIALISEVVTGKVDVRGEILN